MTYRHSLGIVSSRSHRDSILGLYWGNIGIMEKKMETTIVYWAYIGMTKMQGMAKHQDHVWLRSRR